MARCAQIRSIFNPWGRAEPRERVADDAEDPANKMKYDTPLGIHFVWYSTTVKTRKVNDLVAA